MANFVQSVVGDSIARLKSDVQSIPQQVQSGIQGAISNARNNAVSAVRGTVNNAVNTGVNAAVQSATQAIQGNFAGALQTLADGPANIFSNALAGLNGRSASSLSVSGPLQAFGSSSTPSGTGGVTPGDGLGGIQARTDPLLNYCWYCEMPVLSAPTQSGGGGNPSSLINSAGSSLLTTGLSALSGPNGILPLSMSGGGDLSSLLGTGGSQTSTSQYDLPWYFIEEATLPFRVFGTRAVFREGRDRHYVDKYSVDNLACTLYADTSNRALDYLQAWNSNIILPFSASASVTDGGHFGRPSQYKQLIRFYFLSVAKQQVSMVEYTECWPVSMDSIGLGSDASDRVQYRVSFSVGDVFVTTFPVDTSLVANLALNPTLFPTTIEGAIGSVVNAGISQVTNLGSNLVSSAISSIFS